METRGNLEKLSERKVYILTRSATGAAAIGGDIVWHNSSVRDREPLGCFAGNFCPAALTMSC